mgnify:CR=1
MHVAYFSMLCIVVTQRCDVISDVVVPTDNEVGAKNIRKLVGLHAAHSSAFEVPVITYHESLSAFLLPLLH